MRLAALSVSVILLSGCSWLGGHHSPGKAYQYKQSSHNAYANGAQGHFGARGGQNPCVIYSPVQPAPTGCHPSQVVLSGQQGYQGSQPTYTTGGYGSHAGSAYKAAERGGAPRLRKPKLRGTFSLGTERSIDGDLISPDASTLLYNPSTFDEGFSTRAPNLLTTTAYTSQIESINSPTLSFNDAYRSPLSLKAGLEYIVDPKFTLFANGGITHAKAKSDASSTVVATLLRTVTEQPLDPVTGNPVGTPLINTQFIPNQEVANFSGEFNDHRQYDLEVGARRYLKPIYQEQGFRTITPFVGASAGVSYVNDVELRAEQNQLFLQRAFENGDLDYYNVPVAGGVNTLYESDWLVNGALTTGLEWQLTPKTALAFETGLKAYQKRDFVSGDSGDLNVVVPLTLRGSYNF